MDASPRRLVDLAHVITDGMVTYPGIPGPRLGSHLTFDQSVGAYAPGTEFSMATVDIAANTGTYLDTPAHRYRDGEDLSTFPLERMVDLPGLVVRTAGRPLVDGRPEVGVGAFAGLDVAGRAVLVDTGHAATWGTDAYTRNHPYLDEEAAAWLVARGAALVGIDSLNIDGTHTGARPAHSLLLGAGIPVVEHLTALDQLPDTGFRFTAAPPKIVGMGTFTVRAFALVGP